MYPAAALDHAAVVTAASVPAARSAVVPGRIPGKAGHGQPSPAGRSPPETV
ncbi:hypothetical protein Jiend_62660 [Micromonospora endophytica]|nr:hypothetical protein Jiend_62660 [Micromonospora endophytica]